MAINKKIWGILAMTLVSGLSILSCETENGCPTPGTGFCSVEFRWSELRQEWDKFVSNTLCNSRDCDVNRIISSGVNGPAGIFRCNCR